MSRSTSRPRAARRCLPLALEPRGFGLVALRSNELRGSVIATQIGGMPEVIVDGVSGFLRDPGDVAGMSAIAVELARDPALRARVGRPRARGHRKRSPRRTRSSGTRPTIAGCSPRPRARRTPPCGRSARRRGPRRADGRQRRCRARPVDRRRCEAGGQEPQASRVRQVDVGPGAAARADGLGSNRAATSGPTSSSRDRSRDRW